MREIDVKQITDVVEKLCIEANGASFRRCKMQRSKTAVPVKTVRLQKEFWTISSRNLRSADKMCTDLSGYRYGLCFPGNRSGRTYGRRRSGRCYQ